MYSLLISQVGYHKRAAKKAFLRSAAPHSGREPIGFSVYAEEDNRCVYTGVFDYWGQKWETYWWEADFTQITSEGSYYLVTDVTEKSNTFIIADDVFVFSSAGIAGRVDLTDIAMDQLDARLKKFSDPGAIPVEGVEGEYIPGWRDCGSEIRELSSHIVTLHALIDMLENEKIYSGMSAARKQQILRQIKWGGEYIMFCQEHSKNPIYNGRFNHDGGRQTDYGTTGYHNWHSTAYAITALSRAYLALRGMDGHYEFAYRCLDSAKLAFQNAVYRPYNIESDFQGRTDSEGHYIYDDKLTGFVNDLARQVYNKPDGWNIPCSLNTKDKLTFLWACTLMYRATDDGIYKDTAIQIAAAAAERQFVDWERPIEDTFGMFYAFEGDDETFMLEWNQNHRFHMGNIEPTNLKGFVELYMLFPSHPDALMWYNTVKTYAEFFVKKSAALSPLGIYPITVYKDEKYGGVKFFQVTNHGATGMYGQIAKNLVELADFLSDPELIRLAENNLQFVAGLNPGIPESYDETKWSPKSLIIGLGAEYFYACHALVPAPVGSGINGFSADVQFAPTMLGTVPDAPKGILNEKNEFQFNEDYLPHSHGYVSGVAWLEKYCELIIETKSDGLPVHSQLEICIDGQCYDYDCDGQIVLEKLALLSEVRINAKWGRECFSRSLTVTGEKERMEIDFTSNVFLSLVLPETVCDHENEVVLSLHNPTNEDVDVELRLSSYGVTIPGDNASVIVPAGSTVEFPFRIEPVQKRGIYTIKAEALLAERSHVIYGTGKMSGVLK